MSHEEYLDALLQERAHDLPGDLRAFSFVGRGKRFIEQDHGARRQMVDDLAHSAQFFSQLSALHLYEFAHRCYAQDMETAMFVRAERQADGGRTFKLREGDPLQTSYGEDLYRRIFEADGR